MSLGLLYDFLKMVRFDFLYGGAEYKFTRYWDFSGHFHLSSWSGHTPHMVFRTLEGFDFDVKVDLGYVRSELAGIGLYSPTDSSLT